jgi:hypothetical protein
MRLGHGVLAPFARLAGGRRVGKIWRVLFDELGLADEIDWPKVAIDSCSMRALFGEGKPAPIAPIAAKWLEASCCLRWSGDPAGHYPHWRERPRFPSSGSVDRCDSTDQAP